MVRRFLRNADGDAAHAEEGPKASEKLRAVVATTSHNFSIRMSGSRSGIRLNALRVSTDKKERMNMQRDSTIEPPWTSGVINSLSWFHGKRFAVVLTNGRSRLALRGKGRYTHDDEGHLLRIEVNDEANSEQGNPVFMVRENRWAGCIVADGEFGCEFQLRLNANSVPHFS
jgi:hypothetical protein